MPETAKPPRTISESEAIRLLVVSRQPASVGPLWSVADGQGWKLEIVGSGCEALECVQAAPPDVVLLDLGARDSDALHTLRWLRRLRADLSVVLLAQAEDQPKRLEAALLGEHPYLLKPLDAVQLAALVDREITREATPEGPPQTSPANNPRQGREEELPARRSESLPPADEFLEPLAGGMFFLASCPPTYKLLAQAERLSQVDVPVLISGESGSGKETTARLIHKRSARSGNGFCQVHCAALNGDLLERDLFGYEAGAFPGAAQAKAGKLERAENGTLLLHDIVEAPLSLQAKLLHFLQEREFFRLGGESSLAADVRILATTSADLEQALAGKRLRPDLYYRLSAFAVHVPPLRQRQAEIPRLLEHFMKQLARHYGLPARQFSAESVKACQAYTWPGNLRELESFVKRYLVMGDEDLRCGELRRRSAGAENDSLAKDSPEINPAGQEKAPTDGAGAGGDGHKITRQPRMAASATVERPAVPASCGLRSLVETVKGEAERSAICMALERTRWNRKAAARLLKVSYRTLLYKIQQYRMTPPGMVSAAAESPALGGKNGLRQASLHQVGLNEVGVNKEAPGVES